VSPSRILGLVAEQVRAERDRLRLAALAGAVVSATAVCLLGLSGWFITGAAIAGLAGGAAVQAFNYMMPSAVIRLLAIVRTGARYVERVAGHEAALRALARLRPQLFDAVARAPVSRALSLSSGEASARFIQDVDAVQTLFVRRSAPWSLGAGATAAVLLAALAAPLAAVALLMTMAVVCGGCIAIGRNQSAPAGREVQIALGAFKNRLSALEAVAPELKAYALDAWAAREAEQAAARYDAARFALARAGAWMLVWQAVATAGAVALVFVAASDAAAPLVALAILAAVMGVDAAAGLAGALHDNGSAQQALDRLDAVLPVDGRQPDTRTTGATLRLPLLDGPLSPPTRIGLFGPSGCGKTSFVERLIGLRDAQPGEAMFGDIDAASLAPGDRRTRFAYSAQDVRLLNGTIRENLLVAGPADDAGLWAALEDAGLAERVRQARGGLDALVGSNGRKLSGGERRRLGLARAYLRSAPWLVLDEPTEGLDALTEAQVLAALDRRLRISGQGLILISHRTAPLALCDRTCRMDRPPTGLDVAA
jgi:ATP-binding cassette subfamily C protein CydC